MTFYLYIVNGNEFSKLRKIPLVGKNSGLNSFLLEQRSKNKSEFSWHLSEEDIIKRTKFDREEGRQYALIIDLKPDEEGNISLYRLGEVWGWWDNNWAPIAVRLKPYRVDEEGGIEKKIKFVHNDKKTKSIFEFLYIRESKTGNVDWGRVGKANGALLWPGPYKYLTKSINEAIDRENTDQS